MSKVLERIRAREQAKIRPAPEKPKKSKRREPDPGLDQITTDDLPAANV